MTSMSPTACRTLLLLLATCLACTVCLGCGDRPGETAGGTTGEAVDAETSGTATVDFSFVFIGCNRLGWSATDASTANVPQLQQTLEDISNLNPSPRFLFFVGDLVRNETQDDGSTLNGQLNAWQTLWSNGPLASSQTELVPIPGNHEVLYSTPYDQNPPGCDCSKEDCQCQYAEIPNQPSYGTWLAWLGNNGYDKHAGNGPTTTPPNNDKLVGDNSELTYSFDTKLASGKIAHFVLVNTDTDSSFTTTDSSCIQDAQFSGDHVPGWIPASWIDQDVAGAENDANTELIFALGHKPIQVYGGSDAKGRDTVFNCSSATLADQFLTTLQKSSKFVGYLTSHIHDWQYGNPGGVHQIIAGNGGSPPTSDAKHFGFTLVRVFTDGTVDAISYGRTIPDPIDDPTGVLPATPQPPTVPTVQLR